MRPALAVAATMLAGCTVLLGGPNDPMPRPADGEPRDVTDCAPPYAFDGAASIADLGLADVQGLGADANRQGTIRITEWTVEHEEFAPPDVPVIVPEGQLLCVTWADGSGMTMMLAERFPPAGDDAPAEADVDGFPLTQILLVLAILVVLAASGLAFRRAPEPPGGR